MNIATIVPALFLLMQAGALFFLTQVRKKVDVSTPEGAKKAKSMKLIITLLAVEAPLMAAFLWYVLSLQTKAL